MLYKQKYVGAMSLVLVNFKYYDLELKTYMDRVFKAVGLLAALVGLIGQGNGDLKEDVSDTNMTTGVTCESSISS